MPVHATTSSARTYMRAAAHYLVENLVRPSRALEYHRRICEGNILGQPSAPLPSLLLLHRLQQNPQVVRRRGACVLVIGPQSPLTTLDSAAKEGLVEEALALRLQQSAQVVDRRERVAPVNLLVSFESYVSVSLSSPCPSQEDADLIDIFQRLSSREPAHRHLHLSEVQRLAQHLPCPRCRRNPRR